MTGNDPRAFYHPVKEPQLFVLDSCSKKDVWKTVLASSQEGQMLMGLAVVCVIKVCAGCGGDEFTEWISAYQTNTLQPSASFYL